MKGFFFRLEPVLRLRSEKEQAAVLAQSRARKDYREQLDMLESIRERIENVFERSPDSAGDYLAKWLYIDSLKASREMQERAVEKARRELEKKRREVTEARKDRLTLQKLKDRQYQWHVQKLSRLETKITDEHCTAQARRKEGLGE